MEMTTERKRIIDRFVNVVTRAEVTMAPSSLVGDILIYAGDLPLYKQHLSLADFGWRGSKSGDPYYDADAPKDVVGWLWGYPVVVSDDLAPNEIQFRFGSD